MMNKMQEYSYLMSLMLLWPLQSLQTTNAFSVHTTTSIPSLNHYNGATCTTNNPNSIHSNIHKHNHDHTRQSTRIITTTSALHADNNDYNDNIDANTWTSSNIPPINEQDDWEETVSSRQDGSMWSSFESNDDDDDDDSSTTNNNNNKDAAAADEDEELDDGEQWLDAIAAISQQEIEFINEEADRADKVRQMQEWGFSSESISSTLGVAVDDTLEVDPENVVYEQFKEETAKTGFGMYLDDEEDLELVESHTKVQKDEETGDPVRTQMVYVDEHTCIGCTNCAMVAQSTFFMESGLGRARVFNQWGDDDETIQIAIETCPVDCIHYVPYDELVRLEVERRDQNINFKARLVNQQEYGGNSIVAGFTAPQQISGNMGSRCNNCPSRGCKDCPMYGVGKNPYFEKKEQERKEKAARRRMKKRMEDSDRSAEL